MRGPTLSTRAGAPARSLVGTRTGTRTGTLSGTLSGTRSGTLVGTLVGTLSDAVHAHAADTPDAPALVDGTQTMSYEELHGEVARVAEALALPTRSVVLLSVERTIPSVVAYLALQRAGHVPLLSPPGPVDELLRAWDPAAAVRTDASGTHLDVLGPGPTSDAVEPHPDLGLLLSTSGSTGSPKLVRLSHRNIVSNAAAIGEALDITSHDRAITSLPLHYCYGLSVLHSHLLAGASLVLSEASVVDPCFATALERHAVTSFAGVPHTFELLERSGFDASRLPHLRMITQAGGRMAPERVRAWADRLAHGDTSLVVMYGQTEATARMAVLPPELTHSHAHTIGRPVPGGSFEIVPHPGATGDGVGELVYRGPNVMMGYATAPADLAAGETVEALHTGDLARHHADADVYEIVGRASRFVKPFGLRIDLDRVEARLGSLGWSVATAGDDEQLVVAVVAQRHDDAGAVDAVRSATVTATGLPAGCVNVVRCDELPRTPNGKIDSAAVASLGTPTATRTATRIATRSATDQGTARRPTGTEVAQVLASVLGRAEVRPHDTFVGLGGDSLSYVECSLRLEHVIGTPPPDWHLLPVEVLQSRVGGRARSRLDITVALRALAICTVVATHMGIHRIPGGAHTLLAVAGYNMARFQLPLLRTRDRVRAGLRTAARVALPTSLWIGLNMLLVGGYSLGTVLLVNGYTGSSWRRDGRWEYWFIEAFVQLTVVSTLVLAVPAVRRLERRAPFGFALAVLALLLPLRFGWVSWGDPYNYLYRTHTVALFFVLGWAASRAAGARQQGIVTAAVLATVPGYFEYGPRGTFVTVCCLALLWFPTIPLPRWTHRPLGVVAAASMWIYLVHYQVWPPLDAALDRDLAYVLTVGAGIATWWVMGRVQAAAASRLQRPHHPTATPR